MLYELASGRHAFEGNSIGSVLAATATQEPRPLDGVPEKLNKVHEGDAAFERKLYVIRKRMERLDPRIGPPERMYFYVPSLSRRT